MEDWIEHRRGDGERLGWMRQEGEKFVPVDLLGRDLSGPLDWLAAEELLEETGIGYLAVSVLVAFFVVSGGIDFTAALFQRFESLVVVDDFVVGRLEHSVSPGSGTRACNASSPRS